MLSNQTGNYNTVIGYLADMGNDGYTNSTAIGFDAWASGSNTIRLGNTSITRIEGQVPFTTPSDGRFKHHVQEDVKGLDFILKLRPVTYQFDVQGFDANQHRTSMPDSMRSKITFARQASFNAAEQIRRSGFIAQEVEQAANASGYNFSGIIKPASDQDHYSLSYESFVVPLVKAVQDLNKMVEELKDRVKHLEEENKALKQQ
jgi:hypothetical protein